MAKSFTDGLEKLGIGVIKGSFAGSNTNYAPTMTEPMLSLWFINDGGTDLTLTVNSINMTVKPGEILDEAFDAFMTFTVTNAGANAFRVRWRG